MKRRLVIHAENGLQRFNSKVENALIRYLNQEIVGIIDPVNSGKTANDVLGFGKKIPIAASLEEFLEFKPNYLLIGASSVKTTFPMDWYPMIIKSLQDRIHILNGLYQSLASVAEFKLLAEKYKTKIIDLRLHPDKNLKYKGQTDNLQSKKVVMVGTNENAGRLTSTIEIVKYLHRSGISADWVATGLASYLIKNKGVITESLKAELISGFIENELIENDQKFEFILVEGQGELTDPYKAPALTGILHGARPDALIMCQKVETSSDLNQVVNAYNDISHFMSYINSAPVAGISLNTSSMPEETASDFIVKAQNTLNLPVFDPIRFQNGLLDCFKKIKKK